MRRVLKLLLFLLFSTLSQAQTLVDSVAYRFVYDVQLKLMEGSKRMNSDEHWLEIGKNGIVSYFSAWKAYKTTLVDSVFQSGGNHNDVLKITQERGVETSYFDYYIYKNLPIQGKQTVILASADYFQYEEDMGQDWEPMEGDTVIMEHPCQKASCRYHGRTWTAYYATDIPIAEGPWKLCGLPGLILKASDSKNEFIFSCIGILNNINAPIRKREEHLVKTTAPKAHHLYELCNTDFDNYMNFKHGQGSGKSVAYDKNGRVINKKTIPMIFIEHYK